MALENFPPRASRPGYFKQVSKADELQDRDIGDCRGQEDDTANAKQSRYEPAEPVDHSKGPTAQRLGNHRVQYLGVMRLSGDQGGRNGLVHQIGNDDRRVRIWNGWRIAGHVVKPAVSRQTKDNFVIRQEMEDIGKYFFESDE